MDKYKAIQQIAKENDGIIRTKDLVQTGIRREILSRAVDAGILEREDRGIYVLSGEWPDEYVLIQKKYPKCIFSYGTALYFWGMSDRVPDPVAVSVPQGYNASCLKQAYPGIQVHFAKKVWWEVGITETISPQGGKVRVYNKERCLCDLVRDKEKVEMQIYIQAVREYFGYGAKDLRRLLKYAELFSVEKRVRSYMEVLL